MRFIKPHNPSSERKTSIFTPPIYQAVTVVRGYAMRCYAMPCLPAIDDPSREPYSNICHSYPQAPPRHHQGTTLHYTLLQPVPRIQMDGLPTVGIEYHPALDSCHPTKSARSPLEPLAFTKRQSSVTLRLESHLVAKEYRRHQYFLRSSIEARTLRTKSQQSIISQVGFFVPSNLLGSWDQVD